MDGKSQSNRIKWIDVAKGIGIILVLFSHSTFPESVRWAEGIYIPIFFFLFGYNYSMPKIGSKAKSLLIPYLLYNVLIISFAVLTHSKTLDISAISGVLYSRYSLFPIESSENVILLGYGNAPLWFLTAMYIAYLLFLALCQKSMKTSIWMCAIYILVTIALRHCPILLPWSIDCAFFFALIMFLGYKIRPTEKTKNWIPVACLIVYTAIMLTNGHMNLSIREFGKSVILCALSSACGCIILSETAKIISKSSISEPIALIGRYSLSIFSLQLPVLHVIKQTASKIIPGQRVIVSMIQVVGGCIIGILFSLTMSKLKRVAYGR